mgnify:FL=1
MKKNAVLVLTRTLYTLFITGTLISLFIASKDIDSNLTFKVLMGYLFFTFFMILYVTFVTILNSRRLKQVEIRKRLFKFIALFALFEAINYVFDYVFRPSDIDLFRAFSNAIGLAFGISFIDVIFLKKEK